MRHSRNMLVFTGSRATAASSRTAATATTSAVSRPRMSQDAATPGELPAALLKQARSSGQLNLSNRGLTSVPETVWRINLDTPAAGSSSSASIAGDNERWWDQTDLTKLIVASNKITSIDAGIGNLAMLTVFDAHDNAIAIIDDAIGSLSLLKSLNVSHNALLSLPSTLSRLCCLVSLNASNNSLTALPAGLAALINLEELVSLYYAFYGYGNKCHLPVFSTLSSRLTPTHSKIYSLIHRFV
jgi:Leucine-rich repeat (LRR) protein